MRLIAILMALSFSPRLAWSSGDEAFKALIPGMGHFSAQQDYKGLFFATSQAAALYWGIAALSKREAAVVGTRLAVARVRSENYEDEQYFYNQRVRELGDEADKQILHAGAAFAVFAGLYAWSIVDAWLIPASTEPNLSLRLGVNAEAAPVLTLQAGF